MPSQQETLEWIQTILAPKKLSKIEEVVFCMALAGISYRDMAQETGYDVGYLKDIGSQLWLSLSQQFECKINKRNLSFILTQFSPEKIKTPERINTEPNTTLDKLEFPGCPLAFGSSLYIERPPIETLAIRTLHQPGSLIRLKAPHRMGKTSLIHRLIGIAHQAEIQTVLINMQQADTAIFQDLDRFLRWICWGISQQLHLPPKFDDYWFEGAGSKMSCTVYLQEYFLRKVDAPLVIAFDKVHSLCDYPDLASHFFSMLRYGEEQVRTQGNWQKLRLILAYSSELTLSLHTHQSPFNVGLPLNLPFLSDAQIRELAQRDELDQIKMGMISNLDPLLDLVGGHPYLLQLAFYWLRSGYLSFSQLLAKAPTAKGIYAEYLEQLWLMLSEYPRLQTAFYQVLSSPEPISLDPHIAYCLEGLGLVQLQGVMASCSCELYRQYFFESFSHQNLGAIHELCSYKRG